MHNSRTSPDTQPPIEVSAVEDDPVPGMLADEAIQQGQAKVEQAITGYYEGFEVSGGRFERLAQGVTANGDCVVVARVAADAQQPWSYSVFAYNLRQTTDPDFVAGLEPRSVGTVQLAGGGWNIAFAQPGQEITVTRDTLRDTLRGAADRVERARLAQAFSEQDRAANHVRLEPAAPGEPSRLWLESPHDLGGSQELAMSFKDAAFGKRRQAVVEQTIAPLVALRGQYLEARWTEVRAGNNPELVAQKDAAIEELRKRINATVAFMRANPDLVDQPGETIFDPAKDAYIKHMVHLAGPKRADAAARRAAAAYDKNPLDVSTDTKRSSILRWFS